MKNFNFFILGILIFIPTIANAEFPMNELLIYNNSHEDIYIKFYPSSAIFNCTAFSSSNTTLYSLYSHLYDPNNIHSGANRRGDSVKLKTIIGLDGYALNLNTSLFYKGYFKILENTGSCQFSFDGSTSQEQDGIIGYGIYTLEIYKFKDTNFISICNPITIDWLDFNYDGNNPANMKADLLIYILDTNSNAIDYQWVGQGSGSDSIPVFGTSPYPCPSPGLIQVYKQYHRYSNNQWEGYNVPMITNPRSLGNSVSDNFTFEYPMSATQLNSIYRIPQHLNYGLFQGNIIIDTNITSRNTLIDTITNLTISKNTTLTIAANYTFNIIKPTIPLNGYNNLIIEDSATLSLEPFSHLIIGDQNKLTLKSKGLINFADPSIGINNAELLIESGALFCNEGGRINNGSITYEKGYNHHLLCATAQDVVYSDSTKIILADSAVMEIPDGVTMHFNGIKSGLIMKPNSKLKLGVGCKIIFDSSASLIANGATFTSFDSTLKWDGIILNNTDADTITNCTFSNAVTALTITNDANSAYKNRIITNNTFNVPSGGIYKGIYGENNYKILLKGNTFNMPVYYPSASPVPLIYVGVYLKNSSTIEAAGGDIEEDQSTNYSLNIIENTFSNGCASVILANYTSNYLPYILSDNTFNNTASANIIGMKLSGTIRDNNFTSEDVPLGIHLINSSPNLFKNTINSRDVGLHLAGHCYPNLAPYVSGEDLVWTGGNNYITTTDIDNIQLSSSGYVNTDFGNNNFTVENSSSYHIYGWLDSAHSIYKTRDNCWNSSNTSRIYLKTFGSVDTIPVPVLNTNNYSCSGEISPIGWNVSYNGNGIYDSVKLTEDYTGEEQSEADIIYAQALADYNNNFDVQAITDFKYLIDNYPDIEKLPEILYEFYGCYQSLDTNDGQNYREPLYQDIIDYLNDKILSDEYKENEEFSDNAYDIILMAQSIIDLNAAAGGYEFLAFNHPDPNIRLSASWNYAEIEELINSGNGGGQLGIENYELGIEELRELKELQRMDELVSEDPVMSKMKRDFEKTSLERKERLDKQISRETKNGEAVNDKIFRSRQIDIQKEERAKRNVFELRNATKEEKEMRRMEDMALSTLDIRNEIKMNSKHNIPVEYKLEQNYPNPFNPVTTIKYSIPKDGLVKLKIYDVLGKEVMTLINETKETGNYAVEFNGSNLASGAYFYRIESGMYTSIKRMILIK